MILGSALRAHVRAREFSDVPERHGLSADSDDVGRAFRLMSATCSDRSRPPVPIEVGRPFRLMSAGVAERPLDGCDLSISGCMRSSSDGLRRLLLAQTVAAELQAMGIVNDAIQDGVGQSGIPDAFMIPPFSIAWCVAGALAAGQSAPRRDRSARVVLSSAAVRSAARARDSR